MGSHRFSTIMAAIQELRGSVSPQEPKLDMVTVKVNLLRATFGNISQKVMVDETHIEGLLSTTKHPEERICSLTTQSLEMAAKLEDQVGRSWRNKVRVVGIPEGMEGPRADLFVDGLVLNKLKAKKLSNFFSEERAHRMPGPTPKPGDSPNMICYRILNYFRDHNAILQAPRSHGDLQLDNTVIISRLHPAGLGTTEILQGSQESTMGQGGIRWQDNAFCVTGRCGNGYRAGEWSARNIELRGGPSQQKLMEPSKPRRVGDTGKSSSD
ncbi:hypothetical protein NDU88_001926 [Pleurodeles waltl]|uniref:Uncharacterized protein n=1 Tax=Pleurodeles waltl TaxID=8319 RepID=A0AAV7V9R0_PLEWA|nr:hypothetical protein NDU88_001926 [Pleurodeles waltl]